MTLNGFCYVSSWGECYFNPHVHKMGFLEHRHYFWYLALIEKFRKAQIPYVPLFSCQKTYIIILKNLQEIAYFVPI